MKVMTQVRTLGALAALLMAGQHRCVLADIVLSIQSQADLTKTISWNSEVGAIYRIQSAENLDPVSATFPERWTVREAEFPSHGASTVWMDIGDAGWIPRLFHPRLGDKRFYTVLKVGTAMLASPTVTIDLYHGGESGPHRIKRPSIPISKFVGP